MNEVESAARRLVGSSFRLHGRSPETGLDCVGVVALAANLPAPTGYGLRTGDADRVAALLDGAGLIQVSVDEPGCVVLMRVGPGQLHLGVRTKAGMVHADAGLRRVVERPGRPEWEIVGLWQRSS